MQLFFCAGNNPHHTDQHHLISSNVSFLVPSFFTIRMSTIRPAAVFVHGPEQEDPSLQLEFEKAVLIPVPYFLSVLCAVSWLHFNSGHLVMSPTG